MGFCRCPISSLSPIPSLLTVFIKNVCQILSNVFSMSLKMTLRFYLLFFNIVSYIDYFFNIKPVLNFWYKCHLVMMYFFSHIVEFILLKSYNFSSMFMYDTGLKFSLLVIPHSDFSISVMLTLQSNFFSQNDFRRIFPFQCSGSFCRIRMQLFFPCH